MVGAITCSIVGTFAISGGALITAMAAENCGATTAGAETATYHMIPTANGMQVTVYKLARGA